MSRPAMPDPMPSADRIERLQRRRTRLLLIQGLFFVMWQANFFAIGSADLDAARAVDHVKISAYVVWAVLLLVFLGAGGGFILPKAVRAVLNDESTVEHRRRGLVMGFWMAMASALGCYLVSLFDPLSAWDVIHLVLTAGIAAALITFGVLEHRAQRDG